MTNAYKKAYYQPDGTRNDEVFASRLESIHNEVDGIGNLRGLLSIRNKLYKLKSKHEKSGCRFIDCEYEIMALNEIIEEMRKDGYND